MNINRENRPHFFAPTILALLLLWNPIETTAQPSYTFTVDVGSYKNLTESTPLTTAPGAKLTDTLFSIDLEGEEFTLYSEEYRLDNETPLIIYGGGFIRFNNAKNAVVIDGFLSNLDYFDENSSLSYAIDRLGAEPILKVEWRGLAVVDSPEVAGDYINVQAWVYQHSNIVELHYGENTVQHKPGEFIGGGPFIGIFQFIETPSFKILEKNWIIGDVMNPEYDLSKQGFQPVDGIPAPGTIFRFTPNNSSGVKGEKQESTGSYQLFPNPAGAVVTIHTKGKVEEGEFTVRLYDVLGRQIAEKSEAEAIFPVTFELPHPGLFYCEIINKNRKEIYPIVRQ